MCWSHYCYYSVSTKKLRAIAIYYVEHYSVVKCWFEVVVVKLRIIIHLSSIHTAIRRSGASKASGATFADHVAGDRATSYMVVYSSYTTYVNTRMCANGAELAIFEINFYREIEELWPGVDSNGGLMHWPCTTAFTTEPMGLWQLWTLNLALILMTAVSLLTSVQVRHTCQPREVQSLDKLSEIPGFELKFLDNPPPPPPNLNSTRVCVCKKVFPVLI